MKEKSCKQCGATFSPPNHRYYYCDSCREVRAEQVETGRRRTELKQRWKQEAPAYYASQEWKVKCKECLERARYICQAPNCRNRAEVSHHLTYDNWKNEKPEDLMALCRICHLEEHGWRYAVSKVWEGVLGPKGEISFLVPGYFFDTQYRNVAVGQPANERALYYLTCGSFVYHFNEPVGYIDAYKEIRRVRGVG